MDSGDKSWMGLRRVSDDYIQGVNYFLDKAFERAAQGNKILCPCKKCSNTYWKSREDVENHLICHGFVQGYNKWVFHGEGFSSLNTPRQNNNEEDSNMHDDIDGLLHDTFQNVEVDLGHEDETREGPSEDAKRFLNLVEEGNQALYPGCKSFSKLGFTTRLYLLKTIHGWSDVAFTDLLELLKEAFPSAHLSGSFYKAKKMIKNLGLSYEKTHAWRRYKNQLKKQHYDAYETDELRMQNISEEVSEPQFKELLKYWNSEKLQKMSRTNTENRKKLKYSQTVGKTGFSLVRQENQKESSNTLSSKDLFIATRTRKSDRTYKCSEEDTTNKIAEMEVIKTRQSEDDGSVNAFASVMGPEHPGRMRLYGRGVTKSSLKGKVGVFEPCLSGTDDQSEDKIQRIVDERIAAKRKIMDEQFEERQEASRKQFIAQFLVELQLSGATFDANAILARMGSPGEASSAHRAPVRPTHRLSTGSNIGKQLISGNPLGDEDGGDDEDIDLT